MHSEDLQRIILHSILEWQGRGLKEQLGVERSNMEVRGEPRGRAGTGRAAPPPLDFNLSEGCFYNKYIILILYNFKLIVYQI